MASSSLTSLADLLHDSDLLSPEQRAQLAELRQTHPEQRDLAKALIERGWLTAYQVPMLLRGHAEYLTFGPYLVLDVIGEGAMGLVFKARHRKRGHVVALKVIRGEQEADARALRRFRREIRALTRLAHPNVVAACDVQEIDRRRFFAMEYVEGVNLADVIRECRALPLAPALDYVRQAAAGLQHAYEKGLIHRDIKPGNFLLTPPPPETKGRRGRWGVVKLLDLGMALINQTPGERTDSNSKLTAKGLMLGTVDYVAPEQVMNAHDVDIRADLYSLGCMFYEMLTGQVPFPHGTATKRLMCHQEKEPLPVEQLRPELPEEVVLVVRKLMAKAPADRFQVPAHLEKALARLLDGLDESAVDADWRPPKLDGIRPAANLTALEREGRSRRWPLALAAAVAAAGAALWLLLK